MYESESLEATLRRAAEGDQSAWRTIVDSYAARVFGLIRAKCADADLAEEITQSTFCTVATKLSGYTELGKFESWLFRIAINRLRDEMRRRGRQARPMDSETMAGLAPQSGDGGEGSDPDLLNALRSALDRIPEVDRRIIHLRHFAGLSFKQMAELLEQPLGTVLARHHRALKKVRDLLGELPT